MAHVQRFTFWLTEFPADVCAKCKPLKKKKSSSPCYILTSLNMHPILQPLLLFLTRKKQTRPVKYLKKGKCPRQAEYKII